MIQAISKWVGVPVKRIWSFMGRNGFLLSWIAVVLLTVANVELTKNMMLEISGYVMLTYALANLGSRIYTPKDFITSDAQGTYTVLGDNLKAVGFVVGMCVAGMYFAKSDGANAVRDPLQRQLDSLTVRYLTQPGWDPRSHGPQ